MPWDHINKAINRSLPLQQPSKAASSHSSICTNSRQRNPGLRKPHLLSCCFYLSLHCISCQACRSERQEISLYLFVPWCDQGMCLGWNPALGQGCVGKGVLQKWRAEWGGAWLGTRGCSPPALQTDTSEGGSWGSDCFSNRFGKASIPASQPQDTWRTWPCLSWAFQSMSQQTTPKHWVFYSDFTNPSHLFSDFVSKRQNFMHPWGFLKNWQPLRKWSILYFSTIFSVLLLQRLQPYFF